MRLKKLILHGFKSFADRTEFVFDSPITGIVGPNGCGKSNVVDGFKWVLGEQSAKSLRGEAMMDVIFNGSGGRKPAGMSEVTLVFENPRREDGTRLLALDTDEVSVGRRLFRDGTSEYQINNNHARLKDIRELFLDTGVGVDAYSVIEQGRVAALLEANPAERRLIFEEAAGISKYKQKKKEAQRKLEKVDQNLLRVTDIVEEVEKRLRSVKLQAGKARNYQEYLTRLNELRLTYSLQEYHTWHTQLGELESARGDAQFRLDDVTTDLQRSNAELTEKRETFEALAQKRQQTEYQLVQAKAAVQQALQKQHYAEQQLAQIAEQIASMESDRQAAEAKLDEATKALDAENATLEKLTADVNEHRQRIEQRQQAFRDAQLKLNQLNQDIERGKASILDLMRKLSNLSNRLGAIEIERKNIVAQQTRLAERRQVVVGEIETLETAKREIEQKLAEVVAQMGEQQAALEAKRNEAAALGKEIADTNAKLGAAREHRSGLLSRKKVLEDLEAKREGMSEGVKSVLRQRETKYPFIRGLVADVLRVDVEHAHVIEAALDGRDQWLIASDVDALFAATETLAKLEGRVNVLTRGGTGGSPVNSEEHGRAAHATSDDTAYDWNQHPQGVRLAVDLVKVEPQDAAIAQHLLGRTVIVDDLSAAHELYRTGPQGYRYVTKAGQVLEADGTLRAGPLTAAMGIISRRSELNAISRQIEEADARIAELQQKLTAGNEQAKALDAAQNELRNAGYQLNTRKVELTSQVAQNNDKQSALRREQPILDRELEQLLHQTGRLKSEEQQLLEQRSQWETQQSERQQAVETMTADQSRIAEELKAWTEELTAARVELGQLQEQQIAAQRHVQRLTATKAEVAQQIERIVISAKSLVERQKHVERELEQAQAAEAKLEAEQKDLAEQLESLTGRVAEASEQVKALAAAVEELRGSHATIEQEVHQLDMKLGELRVRLETLVTRTKEELDLDLPARHAELSSAEGGYVPADQDWDAVAGEIKELKEKIQRLGNVNLDAIGEQDELEQRSQFYAQQITDLTTSKQQLEDLINEINAESSKRFEDTFNAVREHFQGMFRKLFGGGKADIILETEIEDKKLQDPHLGPDGQTVLPIMKRVDVLDAGIDIIARPPGKQPCSISQLSGGEKAMTCIALLMSIFKSKPSPFCILDEVDAPLDEANNQRFGLIVQEFLEMSQFIIITHHKRTMQICDVLYGVTMQEQGVSKRVAVKFDDVANNGQISARAIQAEEQREAARELEAEHVAA
jgi:chromosome segregation protein